MNLPKQIAKLNKQVSIQLENNGQQGVINLVEGQSKVRYAYHYCRGCEVESPVLETTDECLFCGSTVNNIPMDQLKTAYALEIACRLGRYGNPIPDIKSHAVVLAEEVIDYQSENGTPFVLDEDRLEDICTAASSSIGKGLFSPRAIVRSAYAADDMYKEKKAVLKQLKDNAVTASPRAAFIYNCLYNHLDELDTPDLSQAFLNGSK